MNNKVVIDLISKTNINISSKQYSILFDSFQKIAYLESKIESSNLTLSPNVLVLSLLEREGMDSSLLEGTKTRHDEMYFDISEGIRDKYSWEVRNLINLYKSSFRDFSDNVIDYTVEDLKFLHRKLYEREAVGFESSYDPIEVIKKVKPGIIINNDATPNWIGARNIEDASLIPIKPSMKLKYLEDLFKEVRKYKDQKSIDVLIKFHPIFEAIHPFADGNGRIGRLLLINLMTYLGFSKFNWIFISDYWFKNKEKYIVELKKVQTTNNWNDWVSFFVESLVESIKTSYEKLNKILELYKSFMKTKLSDVEKRILKYFFKYPILNKKKSIENLKSKYKVSNTTAYRSFENVVTLINASPGKNYHFKEMLKIINK